MSGYATFDVVKKIITWIADVIKDSTKGIVYMVFGVVILMIFETQFQRRWVNYKVDCYRGKDIYAIYYYSLNGDSLFLYKNMKYAFITFSESRIGRYEISNDSTLALYQDNFIFDADTAIVYNLKSKKLISTE